MLNELGEKLQGIFKRLKGYGRLDEKNIADALREVRLALLAADVHFSVAKDFCDRVKNVALGTSFDQSIRPGDLFVKIVHDELVATFSKEQGGLLSQRPLRVLLCGLNGAGKTTTAGKLAAKMKAEGDRPVLIAADLTRPAAADQLARLGEQIEVPVIRAVQGEDLERFLKRALKDAESTRATVWIVDTAGRMEIDEELQEELRKVRELVRPDESLLVADAATGQAAVEVAKAFHANAGVTGLILSKFDGDARGGAALSLQSVTGCPIRFLGVGEQVNGLEVFDPSRLVDRMLGMGDIVGLVEKAQEAIAEGDLEAMARRMQSQAFDLQDFLDQMKMLKKLGPLQNILGMIPGMGSLPNSAIDEGALKRTEAIILSMTKKERRFPEILNARRRLRIASGSGTSVTEVNDLMKRFRNMKKMMGRFTRGGNQEKMIKRLLGGNSGGPNWN
ncbi:MAG: signal recognition particle protein [Candidatus Methylacidiphilales bacterium]